MEEKRLTCLFFFSFAHMGSLRTLQFVNKLNKYKEHMQCIGVHIPAYEFEKDEQMIRAAAQKYDLESPIMLDHNRAFSAQFQNQWLPRIIIVGKCGELIFDHIGEGGHTEIETAIQQAILSEEANAQLPEIPPETPIGGGLCYRTSHDIYLGYIHEKYATKEEIGVHEEAVFTQDDRRVKEGEVGLHGHWKVEREYIEHTKTLPIATEHIMVAYSAFSANVIAEPLRSGIKLMIDLDGKPIPEDLAGEDIAYTKEGQSIVKLDFARAYRVIDGDTYHRGQLKIRVKEEDIRLYAVVYGGCRNM
jgi:hypothetical protein